MGRSTAWVIMEFMVLSNKQSCRGTTGYVERRCLLTKDVSTKLSEDPESIKAGKSPEGRGKDKFFRGSDPPEEENIFEPGAFSLEDGNNGEPGAHSLEVGNRPSSEQEGKEIGTEREWEADSPDAFKRKTLDVRGGSP
jgi:hypothetical protein